MKTMAKKPASKMAIPAKMKVIPDSLVKAIPAGLVTALRKEITAGKPGDAFRAISGDPANKVSTILRKRKQAAAKQ